MYCVIWSKKKEDNWSLFSNNCYIFEKEAQEFADKQKALEKAEKEKAKAAEEAAKQE